MGTDIILGRVTVWIAATLISWGKSRWRRGTRRSEGFFQSDKSDGYQGFLTFDIAPGYAYTPGDYEVDFYIEDTMIARGGFEIYVK